MNGSAPVVCGWSSRQRAGVVTHAALAAALVPAYALLAPPPDWRQPVVLGMLAAMAVVVDRHDIPLPTGIRFDALIAVVLMAVAIGGPLPAFAIAVLPMLVNAATGHERLLRAGNLANLAAYGWYTLAGGLVLQVAVPEPTAPAAIGWLVVAGLVQLLVNWAVGPAIYGPLWLGRPFRAFVDMLIDALPAGTVMVAIGAISAILTGPLDVFALALFAAIAVLPGSFLTYAARTRPVARLERGSATRSYAYALGVQLGLGRAERRHLVEVADAARRRPPAPEPLEYIWATAGDLSATNHDARLAGEWWNGRGGPIGLHGEAIPLAARVLAVADAWSGLTAAGTPQLSHEEALAHLEAVAGVRLDPRIVDAVRAVIREERVSAFEPAPEPRLHLLRLPARLRRALAAG
jgi:hypothetical protein